MSIDAAAIAARFERDGFVFPVKVMTPDEAQALRDALEEVERDAAAGWDRPRGAADKTVRFRRSGYV